MCRQREDEKRASIWHLVSQFFDGTTIHGLPRFFSSKRNPLKITWLVLWLAALGVWCYFLALQIDIYLSYEVSTSIGEEYTAPLDFPAISICNSNPFKKDLFVSDFKVQEYFTAFQSNAWIEANGWQQDAFKYCEWNGFDPKFSFNCTNLQPDATYVTANGLCYTWNGRSSSSRLQSVKTGQGTGLTIYMQLFEDDYDTQTNEVAAYVHVHHQDEPPNIPQGISISPGQLTYVGIQQTDITRLQDPHGDCQNKGTPYSVAACRDQCAAQQALDSCGCRLLTYYAEQPALSQEDVCNMWDPDLTCGLNILTGATTLSSPCDCPNPCSQTKYSVTTSVAKWPAKNTKQLLKNLTKLADEDFADVAAIEIYYSSLSVNKIDEEESMDFSTFLGGVGGMLGLFMGVSFMTVVEFLELFVFCCAGCRREYDQDDDDQNNDNNNDNANGDSYMKGGVTSQGGVIELPSIR